MRIVSGLFGGRTLAAPKTSATRPMTDKVRAALFDSVGDIEGGIVLDAYAGSGAVGFEALSRGASHVVALESGKSAVKAISDNQKALDLGWGYSLYPVTVESWLAHQTSPDAKAFDLIVADPPYEQIKEDVLEKLGQHLTNDGIMVVSHDSRKQIDILGLKLARTKAYGDSSLSYYQAA